MKMKKYRLSEHFAELKTRLIIVSCFFCAAFCFFYYKSEGIYLILVKPLSDIIGNEGRRIIYTGLAEAFFTYLKIAAFASFIAIIPVISWQIYRFIAPGLYKNEKRIALAILGLSPILFAIGGLFVFYLVIPKAWQFFLSFELKDSLVPLVLEARISEYLSLVLQLVIAFGLAFQLPIIFAILTLMGLLSSAFLQRKRRLAIVINFIIAGIITPPDVLSQIALALPMVLLYEISIVSCRFLEKRSK
jgi:sec-independent protein translocase protein TatC